MFGQPPKKDFFSQRKAKNGFPATIAIWFPMVYIAMAVARSFGGTHLATMPATDGKMKPCCTKKIYFMLLQLTLSPKRTLSLCRDLLVQCPTQIAQQTALCSWILQQMAMRLSRGRIVLQRTSPPFVGHSDQQEIRQEQPGRCRPTSALRTPDPADVSSKQVYPEMESTEEWIEVVVNEKNKWNNSTNKYIKNKQTLN